MLQPSLSEPVRLRASLFSHMLCNTQCQFYPSTELPRYHTIILCPTCLSKPDSICFSSCTTSVHEGHLQSSRKSRAPLFSSAREPPVVYPWTYENNETEVCCRKLCPNATFASAIKKFKGHGNCAFLDRRVQTCGYSSRCCRAIIFKKLRTRGSGTLHKGYDHNGIS